jgi:hypothetical protein
VIIWGWTHVKKYWKLENVFDNIRFTDDLKSVHINSCKPVVHNRKCYSNKHEVVCLRELMVLFVLKVFNHAILSVVKVYYWVYELQKNDRICLISNIKPESCSAVCSSHWGIITDTCTTQIVWIYGQSCDLIAVFAMREACFTNQNTHNKTSYVQDHTMCRFVFLYKCYF